MILALNEDALYGRLNRYRDQQVRELDAAHWA